MDVANKVVRTSDRIDRKNVPGHSSSREALARMTRSKASPGRERLISESRSALLNWLLLMKVDASHPETKQSWKKTRRVPAAVVGLDSCLLVTASDTIFSMLGQVFL